MTVFGTFQSHRLGNHQAQRYLSGTPEKGCVLAVTQVSARAWPWRENASIKPFMKGSASS